MRVLLYRGNLLKGLTTIRSHIWWSRRCFLSSTTIRRGRRGGCRCRCRPGI